MTQDTLAVATTELAPALEAVLMVADEPLDATSLVRTPNGLGHRAWLTWSVEVSTAMRRDVTGYEVECVTRTVFNRSGGHARQNARMLGPRNSPTSPQPGETARPASGSPARTQASQAARGSGRGGTANSSMATLPPGLTTLTSSRIVAAGSST